MTLPLIPQDKANHFIYGFSIYFLSNLFLIDYVSLIIVFLFALGKELYDQYKYKGFDIIDLLATITPALLLFFKHLIF